MGSLLPGHTVLRVGYLIFGNFRYLVWYPAWYRRSGQISYRTQNILSQTFGAPNITRTAIPDRKTWDLRSTCLFYIRHFICCRHFNFDVTGNYLLVGNHASDRVVAFRFNIFQKKLYWSILLYIILSIVVVDSKWPIQAAQNYPKNKEKVKA